MSSTGAGPGRPVDPEIEPKVIAATLDIYAEVGLRGFTIDAVARQAAVGKAAIYRRWSTKHDLIAAAITGMRMPFDEPFTGPLRTDLLRIAERLSNRLLGPHGLAYMRALVEAKTYPEVLGAALEPSRRGVVAAGRRIVLDAVERGEVSAGISPALLMDALAGTMMHHVLMMPAERLAQLAADPADFNERVVDFVLAGAGSKDLAQPLID